MDEQKKILGVDFGERRIGLAIAGGSLAEPLLIIEAAGQSSAVQQIVRICEQEKIQEIVLGLPFDAEGQVGPAAKKAKNFGQKLVAATGLKVVFRDETLTSEEALAKMVEAGRPQKKRRHLDDVVAALILQEYLDSRSSFAKASED